MDSGSLFERLYRIIQDDAYISNQSLGLSSVLSEIQNEMQRLEELVEQNSIEISQLSNELSELKNEKCTLDLQLKSVSQDKLEDRLKSERLEAEKLILEGVFADIAHTVKNDLVSAIRIMRKVQNGKIEPSKLIDAEGHIQHIKDILDLHLLLRKIESINLIDTVNLCLVEEIHKIIHLIKNTIDVLKHSQTEQILSTIEENIFYTELKTAIVNVPRELKECIVIIILDLVRNAIDHSDEDSPKFSLELKESKDYYIVKISNNSLILDIYRQLLLYGEEIERGSTNAKVGLRLIYKFSEILKIQREINLDSKNQTTTIILSIPKEIKIEP
ncbi:MAG: hypothetical protein IAE91_14235 [Ignavibacteriaceae bacterium]|nr:hypothetical protein [Ignavibacteriaceae bacterium]